MSDLMRELLDEVERLQGELRAQLAPLRDGLQRLTGLESLEEDVARLEGVALDLLRQAETRPDSKRPCAASSPSTTASPESWGRSPSGSRGSWPRRWGRPPRPAAESTR
jgi:hypothetical protein